MKAVKAVKERTSDSYQRIEVTAAFLIDDIVMQPHAYSTEAGMAYGHQSVCDCRVECGNSLCVIVELNMVTVCV